MAKEDKALKQQQEWDKHDDKLHGKDFDAYFGNLDPSSTKDGSGPSNDVNFGSGNSAANYNVFVNDKENIELGLKIHVRGGADILPSPAPEGDGSEHYVAPAGQDPSYIPAAHGGQQRAAWNFDFSVNTGIDGSKKTLDHFDFRIIIQSGDGERGVYTLQHVAPGNTPWLNLAGTAGFADEDGGNAQISQNSVNLGFGFLQAVFGADYNNAGEHYDVTLQAFKGNELVGYVTDSIDIV